MYSFACNTVEKVPVSVPLPPGLIEGLSSPNTSSKTPS